MSHEKIYSYNDKILFNSNGTIANLPCASGCACRSEIEQGVCCSGQWYEVPGVSGTCCPNSGDISIDGVWIPPEGRLDGTCCGNQWYPIEQGPGSCCGNVWYPNNSGCPPGSIYLEWGSTLENPDGCCGCVPQFIDFGDCGQVSIQNFINDLCCPVCDGGSLLPLRGPVLPPDCDIVIDKGLYCFGQCCFNDGRVCDDMRSDDCFNQGGIPSSTCCGAFGCPVSCCIENSDGIVECNETAEVECINKEGSPVPLGECDKCTGACCKEDENGTLQIVGMLTQQECNNIGGLFSGLNSTECKEGCRDQFDTDCCEENFNATNGFGLTFTGPRQKKNNGRNTPPVAVRVTGKTHSPIRIHGTPFGIKDQVCTFDHKFGLCWDKFNIEPMPCGTNFRYLEVRVCWYYDEVVGGDILMFSGCNNITVWLGNCLASCTSVLSYSLKGHTSNAQIILLGDADIEALGWGPLILTTRIDVGADHTCDEYLLKLVAIRGIRNEIRGGIVNRNIKLENRGSIWRLNNVTGGVDIKGSIRVVDGQLEIKGDHLYEGGLIVKSGRVIIHSSVGSAGASPFGVQGERPKIGFDQGVTDSAEIVFNGEGQDIVIERGFDIMDGNGFYAAILHEGTDKTLISNGVSIRVSRDFTLAASTGGELHIAAVLTDENDNANTMPYTVTIGNSRDGLDMSSSTNGRVVYENFFAEDMIRLRLEYGTLILINPDEPIWRDTPVMVFDNTTLLLSGADYGSDETVVQRFTDLLFIDHTIPVDPPNTGGKIQDGIVEMIYSPTSPAVVPQVRSQGQNHRINSLVRLSNDTNFEIMSGDLSINGDIEGSGRINKYGPGSLKLNGYNSFTGGLSTNEGTVTIEEIFASNPDSSDIFLRAIFTPTILNVQFNDNPEDYAELQILNGPTEQTYDAEHLILTGTYKRGFYNSSNSILTILPTIYACDFGNNDVNGAYVLIGGVYTNGTYFIGINPTTGIMSISFGSISGTILYTTTDTTFISFSWVSDPTNGTEPPGVTIDSQC